MDYRFVHVIDDELPVRRSVAFVLQSAGFRVKAWPGGQEFLKNVRNIQHGCIILDLHMPQPDGLAVQNTLRERGVTMPIIILTGHGDVSSAVHAMKNGALDFLEKPFDRSALLQVVERGFARIEEENHKQLEREQAISKLGALTPREREVIARLAKGFPNKTIAHDFGISPRTVEVHRANIMLKLGVPSFPDALRIAFAAGVDEEDECVNLHLAPHLNADRGRSAGGDTLRSSPSAHHRFGRRSSAASLANGGH